MVAQGGPLGVAMEQPTAREGWSLRDVVTHGVNRLHALKVARAEPGECGVSWANDSPTPKRKAPATA